MTGPALPGAGPLVIENCAIELLLVGGVTVVEHGERRTADVAAAIRDVRAARRQLQGGQNGT